PDAGHTLDGARAGARAVLEDRVPHRRRGRQAGEGLGPALHGDVGPGVGGEVRQQRARPTELQGLADQHLRRGPARRGNPAPGARGGEHHPGGRGNAEDEAVQFMDTPDSYYDQLPKRLEVFGIRRIDENPDDLRRLRILIDGNKEHSYLLQIFMKDAASLYGEREAGPFFYEVIQRKGDKGFGAGNFRSLFESIERDQKA